MSFYNETEDTREVWYDFIATNDVSYRHKDNFKVYLSQYFAYYYSDVIILEISDLIQDGDLTLFSVTVPADYFEKLPSSATIDDKFEISSSELKLLESMGSYMGVLQDQALKDKAKQLADNLEKEINDQDIVRNCYTIHFTCRNEFTEEQVKEKILEKLDSLNLNFVRQIFYYPREKKVVLISVKTGSPKLIMDLSYDFTLIKNTDNAPYYGSLGDEPVPWDNSTIDAFGDKVQETPVRSEDTLNSDYFRKLIDSYTTPRIKKTKSEIEFAELEERLARGEYVDSGEKRQDSRNEAEILRQNAERNDAVVRAKSFLEGRKSVTNYPIKNPSKATGISPAEQNRDSQVPSTPRLPPYSPTKSSMLTTPNVPRSPGQVKSPSSIPSLFQKLAQKQAISPKPNKDVQVPVKPIQLPAPPRSCISTLSQHVPKLVKSLSYNSASNFRPTSPQQPKRKADELGSGYGQAPKSQKPKQRMPSSTSIDRIFTPVPRSPSSINMNHKPSSSSLSKITPLVPATQTAPIASTRQISRIPISRPATKRPQESTSSHEQPPKSPKMQSQLGKLISKMNPQAGQRKGGDNSDDEYF